MSTYFDKALQKLIALRADLINFQKEELSETDSRSKIIDKILIDILQWEEKSIRREPHIKSGFIDYYCDSDSNRFVIEAKSTKIDFKIPSNNRIQYTSVLKNKKNTVYVDAIEQARSYAQQKNTSFFVVSNGLHITIAKTFLSGEEKFDLMIFDGIECIEKNINVLIEILSPYKKGDDSFISFLNAQKEFRSMPQHNKTILEASHNEVKGASILAQKLEHILGEYFEDIIDDPELLNNIYCNTQDLDSYSEGMRGFLKGRVSILGFPIEKVKQVETSNDSSSTFGADIEMKRQYNGKNKGHLFILFGNLGAGKTTFLNRYYNSILTDIQRRKLLWLPVDFQSFYGGQGDVDLYIAKKIEDHIYLKKEEMSDFETLKDIYIDEISRSIKGIWAPYKDNSEKLNTKISEFIEERQKNKLEHIDRCLKYMQLKFNYEICLVFDNLDQHQDDIQERVSFYAVTRTKELNALAIVSLRDETYWNLKKRPPLNAYGNITSYQIVSPSMEQVLTKRIDYVLSQLGNQTIVFDAKMGSSNQAVISISFKDLFLLFKDTIKSEEGRELLNNLSSGDIRKGLTLFKSIITSGHIDLNNILRYPFKENGNTIPQDKLIKAIGLNNNVFYNADKSEVFNIFNTNSIDGFYSHYINYRILEILYSLKDNKELINGPIGFVSLEELKNKLSIFCTDSEKLRKILIPLIEKFLVETDIGARRLNDPNYFDNIKSVRITPSGIYHKDILMYNYQYLEMVMIDTPIQDPEVYSELVKCQKEITEAHYSDKWPKKFAAVKLFLDYLKAKEEEDFAWLKKHNINHFGKITPKLVTEFYTNKAKIESKITKKK